MPGEVGDTVLAVRDSPRSVRIVGSFLFLITLVSFVAVTELTQYVQSDLHYRKPYFIFYVTQSWMTIIFPLHFILLVVFHGESPEDLLSKLSRSTSQLFSSYHTRAHIHRPTRSRFPIYKLLRLIFVLTSGYNAPNILFFMCISLTPVTDLTALWNTNAFFAYIFNVLIFHLRWESTPLFAVVIATGGVFMVVYGGAQQPHGGPQAPSTAKSPIVGDILALVASVLFGLYQVYYKRYAALPGTDSPESLSEHAPIYQHIPSALAPADSDDDLNSEAEPQKEIEFEPLPLGLYANLITSLMGLVTLLFFWIPIPILHYHGSERFSLPVDASIYMNIAIIATCGAAFNACIMILLGLWGPVVTSTGNLLTIVLVLLIDYVFGAATETITPWSLSGAGLIVSAFGLISYHTFVSK